MRVLNKEDIKNMTLKEWTELKITSVEQARNLIGEENLKSCLLDYCKDKPDEIESYDMDDIADIGADIIKRDEIIRDEIISKYSNKFEDIYLGGIKRFSKLSLDGLKILIEEGYVDIDDRQNYSPTIDKLVELGKKFQQNDLKLLYSGYAVSIDRDDYRVSIDTIYGDFENITDEELKQEIENLSKTADEVSNDRIWWD